MNSPIITVLTPTKNSAHCIKDLILSLELQTESNFLWLVVDSDSSDSTFELVNNAALKHKQIVKGLDFSIYHGLNRGVNALKTEYYLVVGSDDCLHEDAIANYTDSILMNHYPDFIFAGTSRTRHTVMPRTNLGWLYGMHGVGSSHSVGTLIKTTLHSKFGYYSPRYPMLADAYFIKTALNFGSSAFHASFVAGFYADTGFSSNDSLHYLLEFFEVQTKTERFPFFQFILFLLRLSKLTISKSMG
ncbi:MAG: glycosyltransferase [Synechococcus sp.]